ncbi:glycosyltransferase family 4 protein [Klenkia sp. PcliD-1-E]|uniref:glycosyltransferase family 4 protein n=1 Tax=Klenkia sp. PcliD-1-E TaxID=2954492 RepID=UPI0020979E1D|nr:glycosyltransferase family 4 protein [Klenkia sp. PcliD-1-E]MCO7219997.1 glycosyltransferase family 4 protein [Klenkia sp. PcliD-1-E]
MPADVDRRGRIGLVPARFGEGMVGGAEIVLAEMAKRLAARGWDVEILTTCAIDHFSWDNVLPAGESVEQGLKVRRFPAVFEDNPERGFLDHAVATGQKLGLQQQQRWINAGMRSPELYHHLLDNGRDYRALVYGPYVFWPAYAGSQLLPERSLLWTCLHDEPAAYLDLFDPVLSGIAGLFLQTEPEHELAHRVSSRLAPHAVVGCGVEVPESYDPDGFRERYGLPERFVLYAGRREGAKGWEDMLAAFGRAVERTGLPLSLVTFGSGEVRPPAGIADRVFDLGFLPDHERDNAFAAAAAYIQPSRFEAFSRTVMEAWLAGTPVIANGGSDVVRWHCERSGAGLVYDDEAEFTECLRFVAEAPELAEQLASGGRDYVLSNYTWDVVLDGVEEGIRSWTTA